MTQKSQPKSPPPRKTRSSTAGVIMTMLKVRGNPSKALKNLTIPNGAEVAIISKSGEIIKKLRQRAKISFGSIRKIKVRPVSQTTKTQGPIINQAAFEPDARSLAILEGLHKTHAPRIVCFCDPLFGARRHVAASHALPGGVVAHVLHVAPPGQFRRLELIRHGFHHGRIQAT